MGQIDAEALKKRIMLAPNKNEETWDELYDSIIWEIDNAPTVEPNCEGCTTWSKSTELLKKRLSYLERPQGKWIYKQIHDYDYWECSNCGELCTEGTPKTMNYCPNCGADMQKGGAENG